MGPSRGRRGDRGPPGANGNRGTNPTRYVCGDDNDQRKMVSLTWMRTTYECGACGAIDERWESDDELVASDKPPEHHGLPMWPVMSVSEILLDEKPAAAAA